MNNENKKHYLIYQTTNLVNNKIYIGKHITENTEDNYFGSGKYLHRAIQKYGLENFEFKILIDLNNEEEMNLLEKCVVTQEFCNRKDTYNINVGGDGGWDYLNSKNGPYAPGSKKRHDASILSQMNRNKEQFCNNCKKYLKNLKETNISEYIKHCQKISTGLKQHKQNNPNWQVGKNNSMYGKVHTLESRQKMSKRAIENNSMHGKIWICNFELEESKIWNKNEPIPDGWIKGRHSKENFKKIKQKQIEKEAKQTLSEVAKADKIKLLYEMYEEFKLHEFEGVVKKFDYKYTRNNLIMSFKAHILEYVPQKCNRWKNK